MEESRSDAGVEKPDEERPRARSQTLVDEEIIPQAEEDPVNSTEKVADGDSDIQIKDSIVGITDENQHSETEVSSFLSFA